ncbi:heat shock factor [Thalassiosira oceanica]|uniref:Heat shock factor n=1 Tax=Thalassiosira oceanica TaxID=159749 RepID=K0T869_THAOC|nr:heat shock factor [Thalassiosira oceanica]|mmetsp:Transcript_17212/g.38778  ORF Transcript_17212/g.38778 Transcript_17212/m.38778 type:complete len:385 (-) Transcript_17212:1574-2728(-)|eukprot:EJK73294.1 heat shock factor [Thalassiosira oceanica]
MMLNEGIIGIGGDEVFARCVADIANWDDEEEDAFDLDPPVSPASDHVRRACGGSSSSSSTPRGTDLSASANSFDSKEFSTGEDNRSFPLLLYELVSDPNTNNSIRWLECGTRFVIADKNKFTAIVLTNQLGGRGRGSAKFTSFTRRLKRWNFKRVPSGKEMGAYYHKDFTRDDPDGAVKITYPAATAKNPAKVATTKKVKARRASTGSLQHLKPIVMKLNASQGVSPTEELNISPTPIKNSLRDKYVECELPVINSDMSAWLSSSALLNEETIGEPRNLNHPLELPPSQSQQPPLSLSEISQHYQHLIAPSTMRRHSSTDLQYHQQQQQRHQSHLIYRQQGLGINQTNVSTPMSTSQELLQGWGFRELPAKFPRGCPGPFGFQS